MTTIELMMQTASTAFFIGRLERERRRVSNVGEFFQNLPEEQRQQLATLKSDDMKNIRLDSVSWMLE